MAQKNLAELRRALIRPDRPWVGWIVVVLVLLITSASMVFSFTAVMAAAEWTKNPSWSWVIAPVFIDGAIIAYTFSYAVRFWRADPGWKRSRRRLRGMTALSIAINVIHAGVAWQWDVSRIEAWVGMVISGSAPLLAYLGADEITQLVFVSEETLADVAVHAAPHEDVAAHEESVAEDEDEPQERPTAPLLVFSSNPSGQKEIGL